MSRYAMNFRSLALAGLAVAAVSTGAHAASDPTGVWMNDTGRGAIEIKDCGGKLCGHVVWVKDTSDAAKGCGKQIIGDLKSVGGGRWDNGWIYSPEKKRNYDVEVKPLENGKLRVMGYAGMKFLSKTMIWTKAPDDLVRCGTTEAKADAEPSKSVETDTAPAVKEPAGKSAEPAKPEVDAKADPAPATEDVAKTEETPEETTTAEEGSSEGGLDLEKFFKKTADGKCKLDTPWIKVKFNCEQ